MLKIMQQTYPVVLTILHIQMTVIEAFVSCQTACQQCARAFESLDMLEVYCSMCRQCRDSRRKYSTIPVKSKDYKKSGTKKIFIVPKKVKYAPKMERKAIKRQNQDIIEDWPEGCPTPPECSSEEIKEKLTSQRPKTTSRTTESTCPPVPTCKPKTTATNCMTPCMPLCLMPCSSTPKKKRLKQKITTKPSTTSKEYLSDETPSNIPAPVAPDINARFKDFPLVNQLQLPQYGNQNGGEIFSFGNNQNGLNSPDYYYMYLGVPKNALGLPLPPNGFNNDITF